MNLSRNQILMLSVLIVGTFVTVLNQTVVSPALPSIMKEMSVNTATAQWLTTGFTLVNAIMIPITAYLMDRFSARELFLTSMSLFTVGSLLSGWAPHFPVLLAGRLIQAAGAGILIPMVMTVLVLTFPSGKRGTALGIFSLVIAFAPAIGPTVAGAIIDHGNWRIMFYLIAGLAVVVVAAAMVILKTKTPVSNNKATLDPPSVVLSTLGFGGLLYGFSGVGASGIGIPAFAATVIGLIAIVAFAYRQVTMKNPMLDISVLKSRRFFTATIIGMVVQASLLAAGILMPIYIQTLHGYSAIVSGLVLLPGALAMGAMGPVAGRLVDKHGPRKLSIVGMAGLTLSTAAFVFLTPNTSLIIITSLYLVRMFSLSLVNMPITTWGINSLDNKRMNHATAINNTLREVAGSLGTAIVISISAVAESMGTQRLHMTEQVSAMFGINVAFGACSILCALGTILTIAFVKGKANATTKEATDKHQSKLEDLINRNIPCIHEDALISEAMLMMEKEKVNSLPIINSNGKAVGFISDGDIMRALASRSDEHFVDPIVLIVHSTPNGGDFNEKLKQIMDMKVSDIGTVGIIGVETHVDLPELCRMLGKNHLDRLPVMEDGRIVGFVSRSDITQYSLKLHQEQNKSKPSSA